MTNDEYDLWTNHHAALFQLTQKADAQMLAAWKPLVLRYEHHELVSASNWMAQNKPAWRAEHLQILQRRIFAVRQEAYEESQRQNQFETALPCALCRQVGVVVVPHFICVMDGQWIPPYATFAVICSCGIGARRHERWLSTQDASPARGARMPKECLRLANYELKNPNWYQQMLDRDNERLDEVEAHKAATNADRVAARDWPNAVKRIGRMP